MIEYQCLRCRSAIRQISRTRQALPTCRKQCYNSARAPNKGPSTPTPSTYQPTSKLDIESLLSKPSWSVKSLLPPNSTISATSTETSTSPKSLPPTIITPQLHRLLRISALPQPTSSDQEAHLLHTLSTQLHFVRAIQAVETTGVAPLVTLRDETDMGVREATVGLHHPRITEALGLERKVGRRGVVRRVRKNVWNKNADIAKDEGKEQNGDEGKEADRRSDEERKWNPLGNAQGSLAGRYFLVESGKHGGRDASTDGLETRVKISTEKSTH